MQKKQRAKARLWHNHHSGRASQKGEELESPKPKVRVIVLRAVCGFGEHRGVAV